MTPQHQVRQLYHLTVQGETVTVEGPPDVVTMYCTIRRCYPPAVSVEIGTIDEISATRHPAEPEAPNKVHSHHVHQ